VPFHSRYPRVRLSVFSTTSADILSKLENLAIDIGISYIDNEPIGRLNTVPLYAEQYMLLVSSRNPLARFDKMTWSEAARLSLCLLTPDTQSRRVESAATRAGPPCRSWADRLWRHLLRAGAVKFA